MAAAAPATAQYGYPQYGNAYGYGYGNNISQFAAPMLGSGQNRLSIRTGLSGILGAVLGGQSSGGRVLSVTARRTARRTVRVRGLANSGDYGNYGDGAYGAVGYAYQPDLSFRTATVDYRGRIRDIDISRRSLTA